MARRFKTVRRKIQTQSVRKKTKRATTKFSTDTILPYVLGGDGAANGGKRQYKKTPRYVHNPRHITTNPATVNKLVVCGIVHANWCGICKDFIPEWNKMKDEIQTEMGSVPVVTWEETANGADIAGFRSKYGGGALSVGGYPTIFKLNRGEAATEAYDGDRNAASITAWLKN